MPQRYSRLEVGPVGQAARSMASGAAASIPEHEGLKNLQAATFIDSGKHVNNQRRRADSEPVYDGL